MSDADAFIAALRPASFRGVPFAVTGGRKLFGRRTAIHDYPFRDVIWVEDLGRKGREITMTGFLVSNSLKYGGGPVLDQQLRLIAAAETKGPGKLVHPTLGELNVSCLSCSIDEAADSAGALTIELTFLEAGQAIFPTLVNATTNVVKLSSAAVNLGAITDATASAAPILAAGPPAATQALGAAQQWTGALQVAVNDATGIFNLASQLVGPYGRYFNGGNLGGLGGVLASVYAADTTVDQLIGGSALANAAVVSAIGTVLQVAGNLGLGASSNSIADVAGAVQGAVSALLAATADPADGLRLLLGLAANQPSGLAASTPIGGLVGDLFRRAALAYVALASSAYQPSSSDDAGAVMQTVTDAIDAEITIAGDAGDDASFNALRALQVAVAQDLGARGANLAATVTVTSAEPIPSLVLAQRLYRDPTRSGELEIEADPVHPLFMPTQFQALAA